MALNREQNKAKMHKGNAMVIAGAGSGKTTTIIERIKWVSSFSGPHEVLAMTFSRKAAGEMRMRLGGAAEGVANVNTYHAWCSNFLRMVVADGYEIEGRAPNFTTVDESMQEKIIRRAIKTPQFKGLSGSDDLKPRDFLSMYGDKKENTISGDIPMNSDAERFLVNYYEQALSDSNLIDFADMLRFSLKIMTDHPTTIPLYKHLIIDEAQDTNDVQFEILKKLARLTPDPIAGRKTKAALFVVGDMDQCIYEWRGAKPGNIIHAIDTFGCELFRLETNYRSTQTIVAAANGIIKNNPDRIDKEMHAMKDSGSQIRCAVVKDQQHEAKCIVSDCKKILDRSSKDTVGILYRTNWQARRLEREFWASGIPYQVRNNKNFMDRKEIKNVMSLLSCIANDKDRENLIDSAVRCIPGFGEATASRSILNILKGLASGEAPEKPARVSDDKFKTAIEFVQKIQLLRDVPVRQVAAVMMDAGSAMFSGTITVSGDDLDKSKERAENVLHLLDVMKDYDSILGFIEDKTIDADAGEFNDEEPRISLMTIHSAKGLEFNHVYMPGCIQALFVKSDPGTWEYNESRRLFYVAVTRAIDRITVSLPSRMDIPKMTCRPCEFIYEIPEACIQGRPPAGDIRMNQPKGQKHKGMEMSI